MAAPVIVVGVSRSGTTLLRVLLGAGPDLAAPPETPWITGAYGPNSLRQLVEALTTHETGPVANLSGITEAHLVSGARAFADTILSAYAAARGKPRVLLKTPKDIPHLAFLARVFPDAHFVHIVRDGRDVALSTVARRDVRDLGPHGALTFDNALRRWIEWEDLVRGLVADGTLRLACRVRYEDRKSVV